MVEFNPHVASSTRRRRTWQETSSSTQPTCEGRPKKGSSSFLPLTVYGLHSLPEQITLRLKEQLLHNRRAFITAIATVFITICLLFLAILNSGSSISYSPDQIPILIPALHNDSNVRGDLGGWYVGSRHRYLPQRIVEPTESVHSAGLIFLRLTEQDFQRTIRPHDDLLLDEEKKVQLERMNQEYISKRHFYSEELEDIEMECQRPSFEKMHFPTCNGFHEIDLSRPYDAELAKRIGDGQEGDNFYLSHGYFRDVFSLSQPRMDSKAVLKVARFSKHEMNYRPLFNARRDALIMERLSASPRIVDIYGFCGSSIFVEHLPHEVEEIIVPGGGWIKQEELNDSQDVDTQNHYNPLEKLSIALEMAESIAELHGYKEGVIVHDDIQLCQWLRNDQGILKLGDFNRARILAWNEEKQEYCKYENGKSYGNYRSPEEYAERPLSQQHDVWSFGNNIYALLTGLWIFYENEDDEVVSEKIVNGTRPFIDPRYRSRSFIERRLVEIAEKCWTYDPDRRPDIFDIVEELRQLVKESQERGKR